MIRSIFLVLKCCLDKWSIITSELADCCMNIPTCCMLVTNYRMTLTTRYLTSVDASGYIKDWQISGFSGKYPTREQVKKLALLAKVSTKGWGVAPLFARIFFARRKFLGSKTYIHKRQA